MKRAVLLLVISLATYATACGGGGNWDKKGEWSEGEKKDPIVDVLPVRRANLAVYERSTGRIEAHDVADVYTRISEVALTVNVEVGDFVKAGDKLALLDERNVRIQLNAARLAIDDANLALAKLTLDLDKARADVKRMHDAPDVFTRDAIDQAILAERKAQNSLDAQKLQRDKAQGELDKAELQLLHCAILAPISGLIVERSIRANELVSASTKVFRIADFSVLEVKLDVPEASLRGLREPVRAAANGAPDLARILDTAQAAFCSVTAFPTERFLGYLDRVAPTVDQARGMVVVTVRIIQNVDEKLHAKLLAQLDPDSSKMVLATAKRMTSAISLRPGMWVDARIASEVRNNVLVAPGAALVGDSEVLWVVSAGKEKKAESGAARRVDIKGRRGVTSEGVFELLDAAKDAPPENAINQGDYIVVRGQALLRDGQKVRINELK